MSASISRRSRNKKNVTRQEIAQWSRGRELKSREAEKDTFFSSPSPLLSAPLSLPFASCSTDFVLREVKHDFYGRRQTAKMKLLPSVFSCLYSRVKVVVFAVNGRRCFSIFV